MVLIFEVISTFVDVFIFDVIFIFYIIYKNCICLVVNIHINPQNKHLEKIKKLGRGGERRSTPARAWRSWVRPFIAKNYFSIYRNLTIFIFRKVYAFTRLKVLARPKQKLDIKAIPLKINKRQFIWWAQHPKPTEDTIGEVYSLSSIQIEGYGIYIIISPHLSKNKKKWLMIFWKCRMNQWNIKLNSSFLYFILQTFPSFVFL